LHPKPPEGGDLPAEEEQSSPVMMMSRMLAPEVTTEVITEEPKAYEDMTPSEKRAYTIAKKKAEAESTTE